MRGSNSYWIVLSKRSHFWQVKIYQLRILMGITCLLNYFFHFLLDMHVFLLFISIFDLSHDLFKLFRGIGFHLKCIAHNSNINNIYLNVILNIKKTLFNKKIILQSLESFKIAHKNPLISDILQLILVPSAKHTQV